MINAFFYGIVLAFGLIIPLGVQNVFIFNQGASQRRFKDALPSALTAFVCDGLLILSAVLGVSMLVMAIPLIKNLLLGLGFVFLCYMGWLSWRTTSEMNKKSEPLSKRSQVMFAATVSILNPHALLDTMAVIGTYSLQYLGKAKLAFTSGCLLVSFFWFLGLSLCGYLLKKIDETGKILNGLNKISAVIMWGVAFYLAFQLIV